MCRLDVGKDLEPEEVGPALRDVVRGMGNLRSDVHIDALSVRAVGLSCF